MTASVSKTEIPLLSADEVIKRLYAELKRLPEATVIALKKPGCLKIEDLSDLGRENNTSVFIYKEALLIPFGEKMWVIMASDGTESAHYGNEEYEGDLVIFPTVLFNPDSLGIEWGIHVVLSRIAVDFHFSPLIALREGGFDQEGGLAYYGIMTPVLDLLPIHLPNATGRRYEEGSATQLLTPLIERLVFMSSEAIYWAKKLK
jgi:hypothetical protein